MDTVLGLLFDYNIYFENAHLENILKIINIFLEVDLPLACMTYCRWKKGKGGLGLQWFGYRLRPIFDYNIYFENAHPENILKIINIFLEVDLPLACMTYFRWKREKGGRGLQWFGYRLRPTIRI